MVRSIRYQEIAEDLRRRARDAAPGSLLPSESELSAEFGASRVTIRRALELVRDDGLIAARPGFGWFVSTEPVRQSLERLGTIESQLETSGRDAVRQVVEFSFETPPPHVKKLLASARVLRVKRVNLADGAPFAVVIVCPLRFSSTRDCPTSALPTTSKCYRRPKTSTPGRCRRRPPRPGSSLA